MGMRLPFWVMLSALLAGCSGSAEPPPSVDVERVAELPQQEQQTLIPGSLLQLEDDPGLLSAIPTIVASETMAESGLEVAYTDRQQIQQIPALNIEAQWQYMQTCVGQVASAPVVVVQSQQVKPFTSSDDVIRNIDGAVIASSIVRTVPIVQILEQDFDGSLGNAGFNLRSIMGRLLWQSAGLAERDYPYSCARQQPV